MEYIFYMARRKPLYLYMLILFVLLGCTESNDEGLKINVTSLSKNGTFKATIREGNNRSFVYLTVESSEENGLISTRKIKIPRGYHEPIISMSWQGTQTLIINIDHDFGDDVHSYVYNVSTDTLSQF
jgi:hypothetical protein